MHGNPMQSSNASNLMKNSLGKSCAEYKSCDSCLNASIACHFCQFDYQCHTIGSPMGCIKGMSVCHHLEDCERKEPQHVGYGPPTSVVITVFALMIIGACCLFGLTSLYAILRRSQVDSAHTTLSSASDKKAEDDEDVTDSTSESREPLLAVYEAPAASASTSLSHRNSSCSKLCKRITFIGVLSGVTVLGLMFYPRIPDYNVCNREFQWESVLHSIVNLQPVVEYQVLLSVINENRFGFLLEEGSLHFHHRGLHVGSWELNQTWTAAAGAISDVIMPINIRPGYLEGLAMWSDFQKDKLVFFINGSIRGTITYGNHKIYTISSDVPAINFVVNAEQDRRFCKCKEFYTKGSS
uniref:Uncharacterized protein AlNc14C113G6436 n=1 Tax=Albugo laibachii Nc14 TaxID=890382 RepID=F0WIP3_9STRA|nr:conserved hypothetical protein [Albugo laibachii Nc14]|eukprot:CCA21134.1 conserved hypothetical protein [Albugo laibachii Nc14]